MRVYFRIYISLIACLICFTAEATVREGIYIGAGCGATFDHFEYKATNLQTSNVVKKSINKSHCLGMAFLGYGHTFDFCNSNFFIGGEIGTSFPKRFVTIHRQGATFTNQTFVNHMSVQEYMNIDLMPGYRLLNKMLFYVRAGTSYAKLKLSQDANASANLSALHKKSNKWGLRLGLGLNYEFFDWLGIGIDYIYTGYQKISTVRSSTNTKHAQKTHTQYVGISIIFNFPKNCI